MPWLGLATLNVYSMSMQNSPFHKPIEIKISTVVAISVVLHSLEHATLTAALEEMTGGASDFFDNEFAVIDVGALDPDQLPAINWPQLVQELKAVNLNPVAVRNAPEALHAAIIEHGLSVDNSPKERNTGNAAAHVAAANANDDISAHAAAAPAGDTEAAAAATGTPAASEALAVAAAAIAPVPAAPVTSAAAPQVEAVPASHTLIIDTPVRAGQRIYARGADLIITAVVNNGAEVIADGSIHVYAPLRGRALAGASGNQQARIFAFSMEPELLSIAGMYRTFEDGFPANLAHTPTQAKLVGDRLDLSAVQLPGKT